MLNFNSALCYNSDNMNLEINKTNWFDKLDILSTNRYGYCSERFKPIQ